MVIWTVASWLPGRYLRGYPDGNKVVLWTLYMQRPRRTPDTTVTSRGNAIRRREVLLPQGRVVTLTRIEAGVRGAVLLYQSAEVRPTKVVSAVAAVVSVQASGPTRKSKSGSSSPTSRQPSGGCCATGSQVRAWRVRLLCVAWLSQGQFPSPSGQMSCSTGTMQRRKRRARVSHLVGLPGWICRGWCWMWMALRGLSQ
jgi:hypothetical protein